MNPRSPDTRSVRWRHLRLGALIPFAPFLPAALIACSSSEAPPPKGELTIQTGALQLDDVTNTTYRVTVTNSKGNTVWSKEIDSDDYGDGKGDATYVGPCDASPDVQPNTITLDLLAIYQGDGGGTKIDADTYINPTPLSQDVVCVENADVRVTFNLTIMRDASQGFFDIAVNFDDIFCSAKMDCQDELLHNPATGERDLTAVVAFACTAGVGQDTTLYWGDAAIVCRNGETVVATYPVDPGQPGGQHGPIFGSREQQRPGVFEHAVYLTDEQFEAQGIDKCSWNMALGIDVGALGKNCTFEATATASAGTFEDPSFHTPRATTYPLVKYAVKLTDDGGKFVCTENPLNGERSGVTTSYTTLDGAPLEAKAGCGKDPVKAGVTCSGAPTDASAPTFVADAEGRVTVTVGGQTFGPFALPPENFLAAECCADPCCEVAP